VFAALSFPVSLERKFGEIVESLTGLEDDVAAAAAVAAVRTAAWDVFLPSEAQAAVAAVAPFDEDFHTVDEGH